MFMYYCGQKDSKFGVLKWSQTAAKVLRSRENHVENKNFLGGACRQTPLPARSGSAARLCPAQDMSSTCVGRPLLVLHNFPVFSLLLSIISSYQTTNLTCGICNLSKP